MAEEEMNMMVSSANNRKRYLHLRTSMEELPAELTIDILSRLPVKTIIYCKCVCKKWRNLVFDSSFVNLHLSRSPTGIIIHHDPHRVTTDGFIIPSEDPGILKWVEIEDKVDHHRLHHDPLMSLDLNLVPIFQNGITMCLTGSVNGLICLSRGNLIGVANIYICNPITREYMILPKQRYPRDRTKAINSSAVIVHGFGVSSVTGEYKVVKIFQDKSPNGHTDTSSPPSVSKAEVYTLGTCQWRRVKGVPYWVYESYRFHRLYVTHGTYLNDHCHWIVCDQHAPEKLCSFDFDKETFQLFPSPPLEAIQGNGYYHHQNLGVLKGCLCQLDTYDSQFTIWVMKEYGVKKSWHKEVVIKQRWWMCQPVHLIEGLKDGSILTVCKSNKLSAFYPESKKIEATEIFGPEVSGSAYRPSFLRLGSFESERVVHIF